MADKRLPLFILQSNRDNTFEKDAKLVNGYIEVTQDKQVWVYKRPGITTIASLTARGSPLGIFSSGGVLYIGTTQGFFTFDPITLALGPNYNFQYGGAPFPYKRVFFALMKSSPPYIACQGCLSGQTLVQTSATPFTTVAYGEVGNLAPPQVAAIPPATNSHSGSFSATLIQGSNIITLNAPPLTGFWPNPFLSGAFQLGGVVEGLYIPQGTITAIGTSTITLTTAATATTATAVISVGYVGNLTAGSTAITSVGPTKFGTPQVAAGSAIYGAGIPAGATVQSVGSHQVIEMSLPAAASATNVFLTFSLNGLPTSPVTYQNIPGIAYLDGSFYLADWNGGIWASDFFVPYSYPAINTLTSQGEADYAVYLTRQIQYIILFRDYSIEFFYDAGNAVGSPLAPVPGSRLQVGCANAFSVVTLDGVIYFLAQSRGGNLTFGKVEKLGYSNISNPAIDRLLQSISYDDVTAYAVKSNGHAFYCFTSFTSNVTLAYDITVGEWYPWEDTNGNALNIVDTTFHNLNNNTYTLGVTRASTLVRIDPTAYTDDTALISLTLTTPSFDGGTAKRKVMQSLDIIADQEVGSVLTVSYSDDDYQTWSSSRVLPLTQRLNRLTRLGTFLHRAHRFTHSSPTPFRLTAVEYELLLGVV